MSSWHDHILKHFDPGVAQLTLVHDPDRLVTEEGLLSTITERGYDVLLYGDPVAFRYDYESQYRGAWDDGGGRDLVVVVQDGDDLSSLPFDLLRRGRQLSFTLHGIFPSLSYPVLQELDRSLLDDLSVGYEQYDGTQLGERTTKEFVLLHCYGVSPSLIRSPVDLMRFLLDRHYRDRAFPEALDALLLDTLCREPSLRAFPLDAILSDRAAFLRFLQGQWGSFLERATTSGGDCIVPFEHDTVRVYIDNLFMEGLLRPVELPRPDSLPAWVHFGVVTDPERDAVERLADLLGRVEELWPDPEASHRDWLRLAALWAEVTVLVNQLASPTEVAERVAIVQAKVESEFSEWMLSRFGSLASLPAHPHPVTVDKIPHHLARLRNRGEVDRLALVVLDGISLDQWSVLGKALAAQNESWACELGQMFTWVPSLTPICRQAIFAGQYPKLFPGSLTTTAKDEGHWRRFWEDEGLRPTQVAYRLANLARDEKALVETLPGVDHEVVGIVLSDVDEIIHGATLGMRGVHQQVRLWADQGHLSRLLSHLVSEGFGVFLTSDHGNVAARGTGTLSEGVLVESAGSRARIYDSCQLRKAAADGYANAIEWPGSGLPSGYKVLLAGKLSAFAPPGRQIVTHGGISLEEMVVPFIRLRTDGPHEP